MSEASATPPADPKRARRALLRWYDAHRRDLPWRRTRDPYAIWVSETMLQQTRVETVIPYYERFLDRFPNVEALATADEEEVLVRWAGLGYYSRARNLHWAAKTVVEDFGGELPDDARALRRLPGVGRYTAGALASIAFDKPEAIVDGNVARVLSRLHGIRKPSNDKDVNVRLWSESQALARGARPGDLNQALMELGATICTPRSPDCPRCPLRGACDARAKGDAEAVPPKPARKTSPWARAAAAFIERRGRLLLVRRASGGLLGGLWELPGSLLRASEDPAEGLTRSIRERVGLEIAGIENLGKITHVFTHRRLRLHVFRCQATGRLRLHGLEQGQWVPADALDLLAQASLTRKARALAAGGAPAAPGRRRRPGPAHTLRA